jgi:hypothetical protein
MAYKRKQSISPAKRMAKRRYKSYTKSVTGNGKYNILAKLPNAFPQKMVASMRYAETIRLDPASGQPVGYNFFRCGSIFDPNYTGVGHQPYGHDTYQSIYTHYRVLSSTLTATYLPNGVSSTGHIVGGVYIQADTTTPVLDFDLVRERAQGNFKICPDQTSTITVKQKYTADKNYPNNVAGLNSQFGGNPTEDAYFCVWTTSANDTLDPSSVDVVITIEFEVLMWELKSLGES